MVARTPLLSFRFRVAFGTVDHESVADFLVEEHFFAVGGDAGSFDEAEEGLEHFGFTEGLATMMRTLGPEGRWLARVK